MIIVKKSVSLKSYLIALVIVLSALFADAQIKASSDVTEARFLGIGNKRTELKCIEGARNVRKRFTIFYIPIGKEWYVEESC